MGEVQQVGLIGYGYWGKVVCSHLLANSGLYLRYVHVRSLEKVAKYRRGPNDRPEFVSSLERIWEDDQVKCVVIATPIGTHYELVMEALEGGKHVLVEKPLALTGTKARRLEERAAAGGLVLMTDFTWTFSKGLLWAARLVRTGAIGEVQAIRVSMRQLGRFKGHDVWSVLGSHALAMLDMFVPLGECVFEAMPMMRTGEQVTGGLVRFVTHGCIGYLDVSLHCPTRVRRVGVYGKEGSLVWDAVAEETVELTSYKRAGKLERRSKGLKFDEGHNVGLMLEEFVRCCAGKKDNVELAVAVSSVLEGLR